jgi:hypothetical protein
MSFSSNLISAVAIWRNPEGDEANWLHNKNRGTELPTKQKITLARIAFSGITVLAAIETIANLIFTAATALLIPVSRRPYNFAKKRLDSSRFAFLWAFTLASKGPSTHCANLCTNEASARKCAKTSNLHYPFLSNQVEISTQTEITPKPEAATPLHVSSKDKPLPILSFPNEALSNLCTFLSLEALGHLGQVNKKFSNFLGSTTSNGQFTWKLIANKLGVSLISP